MNKLPTFAFRNLKNLENVIVFCEGASISEHTRLFNLPNKLFANVKHSLKSLSIESIGVRELPKNIFHDNFGMLKSFSLSGYMFQELPETIFRDTRNIRELITNNNLNFLPSSLYKNFKELEILDLSHNKFWDIYL